MNKKLCRVFGRSFRHGYQVSVDAGEFPELAISHKLHFQLAKGARNFIANGEISTIEFPVYSEAARVVCQIAAV